MHLRQQAELRDGKWTELNFEADQPARRSGDGSWDRTGSLVLLDDVGDSTKNAQQKCSRADGWVGDSHVGRREARNAIEKITASQRLIDEPNHGADDFRWRVVRARSLPQDVVIDLEKVL